MITIVIPLYNKSMSICRCIDSILCQTYNDWECVIVDDGSTDGSRELVANYNDSRIRYIYQKNGGVSSARNKGLELAKGEFVLFLDADDYLLPNGLFILMDLMHKYNTPVSVGNYYLEFGQSKRLHSLRLKEGIIKYRFLYNYMRLYSDRAGAALYKKSILPHNPFNTNLSRYEDTECMIKILEKYELSYSPEPVMSYTNDFKGLSSFCRDPYKDYAFSMNLNGKGFWERLILVGYLRQALSGYPNHRVELIKIHRSKCFWLLIEYPLYFIRRLLKKTNLI